MSLDTRVTSVISEPYLIRVSHDFVRLRRVQDSHEIAICNFNSAFMNCTLLVHVPCLFCENLLRDKQFSLTATLDAI